MLMNGDFWLGQAVALADRAQREPTKSPPTALVADLPARWEPAPPVWQFGSGKCDAASGRTTSFVPLAHWTGSAWQGSASLPDEHTGWVLLHVDGGHPGDSEHAAIRRWTAPADGTLTVAGTFAHASPNGDGVRARAVSSSMGVVGEWTVHNGETPTKAEQIHVKTGETVDFVTDCRENVTSDSFTWPLTVSLTLADGSLATYPSKEGFCGPLAAQTPLEIASLVKAWQLAYLRLPSRDELQSACEFVARQQSYLRTHPSYVAPGRSPESQALANLCHALLSTNEFLYVD
jgi:hypothetical protein